MKKIMLLAGMLTVGVSLFAEVDFNDKRTVDNIALAGLNSKIKQVDKGAAGRWYLYQGEYSTWRKVRDDEFELDGAIEEAYTTFVKEIKKNKEIIGQNSTLRLGAKFNKYNFKKQQFPLSLMQKNSYVSFHGDKLVGYGKVFLSFDNINPANAILPMSKADAKNFIKKRKDNGYVDRSLTAKYSYIIKSIKTPLNNIEKCQEDFSYCNYDLTNIKVIGHITKLEILDKNGDVLKTYDNYK